jgi:hypothetical protein
LKSYNIKEVFSLNKNLERKRWEFTPNENIISRKFTSYTISFSEIDNEDKAWDVLFLAIQK